MDRRKILMLVAATIAGAGTLLIFLYVKGADARAAAGFEQVQVLKAVDTIAVGESVDAAVTAGKVQRSTVPVGQVVPGALDAVTSLSGQVAVVPIAPGEQILASKFATTAATSNGLALSDGHVAISLNLSDTGRVAGFVNPGARVAVFLTGTEDTGERFSRLLLPDVEVVAVGATTLVSQTVTAEGTGATTTEQLPRTLFTLSVDQDQAETLLFAQGMGELAFALLAEDSEVEAGSGVDSDNVFRVSKRDSGRFGPVDTAGEESDTEDDTDTDTDTEAAGTDPASSDETLTEGG
ncbi:Flp pilus assembly protein CpaB [Nocardioidaceae bacterium]|nr:Flp pilus assembly protein CpaB [Nocardioidaceae bacterium]